LQAELVHHHLTREINRQAVDPVLEANWGPAYRGKVRLEAAPLSDANQGFLRQLVTQVLADPKDFADLFRRADWPAIFDAVGLPQTKASSAAPSGLSAILSAVGQLQREALEGGNGATRVQPAPRDVDSTAGPQREDLAVESQEAHTEGDAGDALRLWNFNPNQPRDEDGKWTKDGASAARSAAKRAERTLAEAPPSKDAKVGSSVPSSAETPSKRDGEDETVADKLKKYQEKIEEARSYWDAIKNNRNVFSPGWLLEQSSGQLNDQIGKFIDALEQFNPQTPGGKWYKAAMKAIYKAATTGDASDAGQLRGKVGLERGLGDRVCSELLDKAGLAPAAAFERFSNDLVDKIDTLAEKKKRSLPRGKSH
jgi:hypothetical protein